MAKRFSIHSRDGRGGFTLVELAIVMTIVALLIGGVLKGQEMVQNAKVTATIAQVQDYKAAVTTFTDAHGGLMPGDIGDGGWAASHTHGGSHGFGGSGKAAAGQEQAEDDIIGSPAWGSSLQYKPLQREQAGNCGDGDIVCMPDDMQTASTSEAETFWLQLSQAGLISGISGAGTGWGLSHPSANTGGGFVIGYADGTPVQGFPSGFGPHGHYFMLVQDLTDDSLESKPLTNKRAESFDRRVDDGNPYTGDIIAYGDACLNTEGASTSGRNCGLLFALDKGYTAQTSGGVGGEVGDGGGFEPTVCGYHGQCEGGPGGGGPVSE